MDAFILAAPDEVKDKFNIRQEGGDVKVDYPVIIIRATKFDRNGENTDAKVTKVVVSAPGNTILGDHAVVHNRPCLVTAVDQRIYLTAEILMNRSLNLMP